MTRIVLADDEPDVVDSTSMVLEANGFEVVTVSDAAKIMEVALRVRPDILLQDVYMPKLDLGRLIASLRARPELRQMRILVFTASTEAEDITRRTGADGFVRKPFEADRIKEILGKFLSPAPSRGR
ncbi:MAG: response regulator [Euryarchaeota archaeon]|nr:response regulator [Euryarchaeota archaeon]